MLDRTPPSALEASINLQRMNSEFLETLDGIQQIYTRVEREYQEYDPQAWMRLIASVNTDFGRSGERWQWIMNNEKSVGNAWAVDFYFKDPHDAVMFQLKY